MFLPGLTPVLYGLFIPAKQMLFLILAAKTGKMLRNDVL